MRLKITTVQAKELEPGDLFTSKDEAYWEDVPKKGVVGEKVYIRTEEPCPFGQEDVEVSKVEIIKD